MGEEERKRAEAAERKRKEEQAAQQRLEQERLEQERIAREEEEKRRQEEETARIEADKRERARLEAEERARQEEAAARQQLEAWLKKNQYAGVNTKKSKMMSSRYPLHDAVSQRDDAVVRLLLRFGANATLKNSSGRTAQELAKNTKGCEAVLAVFASASQVQRGGA